MKNILFFTILFCSMTGQSTEVKLSDVVTRISEKNYKVYENALGVYQAKLNVEKARGDLLPRLNIWNLAKVALDPSAVVDILTTDIAPFLVPANWFRAEEIRLLHLAEKEGYRALWGNQVHIAKSLYVHLLLDKKLFKHVQESIVELERIHRIVKTREVFGGAKPGTARDIEIRILGLKEDEQNLQTLINQEWDELSYLLGYSSDEEVSLEQVSLPAFDDLKPINNKEYEFRVLSSSPERRQFEHFLSALSQVKKEVKYSFLGISEISRGAAGGVFDSLPIQNGLGFGTGSALKIVDAQKEIMKTQKLGVEETLKRQLRAVASQHNSDIGNYQNYKRRVSLSRESKESLIRRMQLGDDIDVLELSESSRNQIQAETALLAIQFRTVNNLDRLNRLLFDGDYSMKPPMIDSLKGSK